MQRHLQAREASAGKVDKFIPEHKNVKRNNGSSVLSLIWSTQAFVTYDVAVGLTTLLLAARVSFQKKRLVSEAHTFHVHSV